MFYEISHIFLVCSITSIYAHNTNDSQLLLFLLSIYDFKNQKSVKVYSIVTTFRRFRTLRGHTVHHV